MIKHNSGYAYQRMYRALHRAQKSAGDKRKWARYYRLYAAYYRFMFGFKSVCERIELRKARVIQKDGYSRGMTRLYGVGE